MPQEISTAMIRKVFREIGYVDVESTVENLTAAFKDFVDQGVWSNLELDDVEDLTPLEMANGLLNLRS